MKQEELLNRIWNFIQLLEELLIEQKLLEKLK
jgi:hypothetical protein